MPSPDPSQSSSFATDVLKLVTGTTFVQAITILASPLLTRLYGPEAFGFLALFTSITSIIGVVACMRYELAIMLPKTDEEAANLLGLCLLCVAVISGLTVPALYFGGDALLSLLRAPGLGSYLILVPPFVFISGVFLALNRWTTFKTILFLPGSTLSPYLPRTLTTLVSLTTQALHRQQRQPRSAG
jgi:lipopolysaccharide exporter